MKLHNTNYIVTGGGGAPLVKGYGKQFHHAIIMRVGKDFVSERIVPVSESADIDDFFEQFVFIKANPWIQQNKIFIFALDAGILILLFVLFFPLFSKRNKNTFNQQK